MRQVLVVLGGEQSLGNHRDGVGSTQEGQHGDPRPKMGASQGQHLTQLPSAPHLTPGPSPFLPGGRAG